MRAVIFHEFGGTEVLTIEEVAQPEPRTGQVLVKVVCAAINPLDSALRSGRATDIMATTFPSGQGFEFSGVVTQTGAGADSFAPGDLVFGRAPRRAQADFAVAEASELAHIPDDLNFVVAAALPTAASTAYAAIKAVAPKPGENVVVSAAAGGIGAVITQLAVETGARVIAIASPANFDYLTQLGATPISYGGELIERIRAIAPTPVDAYLDNFGDGNVATAIKLGVAPERINTIVDFAAAAQFGTQTAGQDRANTPQVWSDIAERVVKGRLTIRIHAVYPAERVRAAYDELDTGHARGKIVLAFESRLLDTGGSTGAQLLCQEG